MKKIIFLLAAFLISVANSFAQITVTDGLTGIELAEILSGSNINVTNVVYTGSGMTPGDTEWAAGKFVSSGIFNFDSGIILSTGDVRNSAGPNDDPNTSDNLGYPGTAEMEALGGANSWDVVSLEFDFVVQSSAIHFDYIFASEDYPEAAPPNNPDFNDVFAFYISGPGITGEENIALVPGTSDAVSIQNINPVVNSAYFVDNTGGLEIQEDGYTVPLTATKTGLIACETYHLRLVISDIHNTNRNSAVYLRENSFVQEDVLGVESNTVSADDIAREGCKQGSFTFEYDEISNSDRIISYIIGGTAVNGVDYEYLDTSMVIPAGETSGTVFINAFADGIPEGQETIELIYPSAACGEYDTVYLYIDDADPIEFSLDGTNLMCFEDNSGQIFANISGGYPPYTLHVTDESGNNYTTTTNPITGLAAGEYIVQVEDLYGCSADALVIGGIFDADTTFLPDGSGVTYEAPLVIEGFNPGQTIDGVDQIQQICLTMEHSYLGDLRISVVSPSGQEVILKQQSGGGSCDLGEPFASGPVDGANSDLTDPGVGYEYCFNASPIFLTMVEESTSYTHTIPASTGGTYTDTYLPAGSYTPFQSLDALVGSDMNGTWIARVRDQFGLDNGYIFNWYISLIGDEPDTLVILEQPTETLISYVVNDATCGNSDGSINISLSNVIAPYTVLWSNGSDLEDQTNLSAGEYTVTVTDANGCQTEETIYVNNIGTLDVTAVITKVNCFGGSSGAINITPTGGELPYDFTWSNSATSEDISGLVAGNYTVSIVDGLGCQISETFTVNQNTQLLVSSALIEDEECNTNNGSINLTVTGGSGSYGYNWSNGANTQDIYDLNAGNYSVNIVDGYGCTTDYNYSVANDLSNCSSYCYLEVELASLSNETCGDNNGAIAVNILNAVPTTQIEWSNGATNVSTISNLNEGVYSISVTDGNFCQVTETFTIENITSHAIASSSIQNENCSNGNGSIAVTVTGGSLPYSFDWSNGSESSTVTGLTAGEYTLIVTDGNGCQIQESYTIENDPGDLTVTGSINQAACSINNGSINQVVTGANGTVSYAWSTSAVTQNLTGLAVGDYTCVITDQTGCSVTNSYTVNQSTGDLSIIGTNVNNETCGNGMGSINITVTGSGLTYLWSNSAVTEDISNLSAGIYSCEITNAQGCSINTGELVVINSSGSLNVSTQIVIDEVCSNGEGSINMNVSGGMAPYTYNWSNGPTEQDISGLSAGIYTLITEDANGCVESHSIEIENLPGTLAISSAVLSNEICGDGTGAINLTVNGGTAPLEYAWSNTEITEDLSSISAGNYSVIISDATGCEVSENYTITNQTGDLSYTFSITNEICSNGEGQIALNVSGGLAPYSFTWTDAQDTETAISLSSGVYSCVISDANGCIIQTQDFTVNNTPSGLQATTIVTDAGCSDNGAIDLTIEGGVAPISITWNTTEITEDISNLAPAVYSYSIIDGNNCLLTGNVTVGSIPNDLSYAASSIGETCSNGTGSINLTVNGGSGSYNYTWSNTATTEDLTGLSAGNYTCTIEDLSTGCSITTSPISVSNLSGTIEIIDLVVTNRTCTNSNGSINLSITGGTAPISYAWSNSEITEDINGLTEGTYSVIVTDGIGCTAEASAVVGTNSGTLNILLPIIEDETCSSSNGSIDITVQGALNPTVIEWSNGASTEDITGLSEGSYSVYITDANGCSTNGTYLVENTGTGLAIASSTISDDICNSTSGSVSVDVIGGLAPYSFNWSNGGETNVIDNLTAGIYSVVVTGQGGCQVSQSFTVNPNSGDLSVSGVLTNETCGQNDGSIDITPIGGSGSLNFEWNNGATTQDLINISEGIYTVTVSDQFNCEVVYNGEVLNEAGSISITIDNVVNEVCGQGNGEIQTTVVASGANILWSNSEVTDDITNLSTGEYTITVVDDSGCSAEETVTVANETATLAITFVNIEDETCSNGQGFIDINVSGTGPFTYEWSNSALTQDIVGLSEGVYSVTVTDGLGCELTASYTVENINTSSMSLSASVVDAWCTSPNGSIDLSVSGGIAPYDYSWSNSAVTQDITGVVSGTYDVVVTDDQGCFTEGTFTIDAQNSGLGFTFLDIQPETCNNSNGQIIIYTGGTADDYYIDGVNNGGPNIFGLDGGTYTLMITDDFGCSVDTVVTVSEDAFFNVVETITDETCSLNNGAISLSVFGGGGGTPTFSWDHGPTTATVTNLDAGVYGVTVTKGGCSIDLTYTVESINEFEVSAITSDEYCTSGNGSIDQTIEIGVASSYSWSDGLGNTQDLTGLSEGIYTCTITSTTGCVQNIEYTIANTTNGSTINEIVIDETCIAGDGAIDIEVVGGSGSYSYEWSNTEITEDISDLSAGMYTVTVTDLGDGCVFESTYTVGSNEIVVDATAVITNSTCLTCADGAIDLTPTGTGYTYNWIETSEVTEDISGLLPGSYSVTITSPEGCDTTMTFLIQNSAGINDINEVISFSTYPNPARDEFTVEYILLNGQNAQLQVYDMLGKIVNEMLISGKGEQKISTFDMVDGVYFIHLKINESTYVDRIIINRK